MARDVHLPVLAAISDRVHVDYVADTSPANLRRATGSYGLRGVLLQPGVPDLPQTDVILITTPVGTRDPYYRFCASRGIAVFAEKPAVTTPQALKSLIDLFPMNHFCVGFQRRTYVSTLLVRELIQNGVLGELHRITLSEGSRMTSGSAQLFIEDIQLSGGGILMDLGCHGIDAAFFTTGQSSADLTDASGWVDGVVDREVQVSAELTGAKRPIPFASDLSWVADRGSSMVFHFESADVAISTAPSASVICRDRSRKATFQLDENLAGRGARTVHQACYLVWDSFLGAYRDSTEPEFTLQSVEPTVTLVHRAYGHLRAGE